MSRIINIKKLSIMLMLTLCILSGTSASTEHQPHHNRNFEEKTIDTIMIVNDVLDVGFSSKKIDRFQAVNSEIPSSEIIKFVRDEAQNRFETKGFYVYCIASSESFVSISLDFIDKCKGDNPTDNIGKMYLSTDKEKKSVFNVSFESQSGSKTLPWKADVLKANSGEGDMVRTAFVCSDMFWLIIEDSAIPNAAGGSYRTEMEITVTIT